MNKSRSEVYYYVEGVDGIFSHLTSYICSINNIHPCLLFILNHLLFVFDLAVFCFRLSQDCVLLAGGCSA